MKVNDKIITEISTHIPQSTKKATGPIGGKELIDEKKVEGTDRSGQDAIVNLSLASKQAQAIKEIIASEPDVREDKVAELKERIESGRYRIDHKAVAYKLVDSFLYEIF
jgi:negative regulator of flagellin synthesis FlgM